MGTPYTDHRILPYNIIQITHLLWKYKKKVKSISEGRLNYGIQFLETVYNIYVSYSINIANILAYQIQLNLSYRNYNSAFLANHYVQDDILKDILNHLDGNNTIFTLNASIISEITNFPEKLLSRSIQRPKQAIKNPVPGLTYLADTYNRK